MLSARAELMGEFKRGEHSNWDPDEEIWTWDKRAAVLAGGEASEDDEDEDKLAPTAESPKRMELGVDPEQAKPNVGAKEVVPEPAEMDVSVEDIAGD